MGGGSYTNSNQVYTSASISDKITQPVGKKIRSIYLSRLSQFISRGQFQAENLPAKLHLAEVTTSEFVKLSVYSAPGTTRPTFENIVKQTFQPTSIGREFGPSWTTHWFKVQITIPPKLLSAELLEFHWDAGNEGLIWSESGDALRGLTGDDERIEWILPQSFLDGQEHTFYIEMACNGMFGNAIGGDSIQPPRDDRYFKLRKANIVSINVSARMLFYDFKIIAEAALALPDESWESHRAMQVCTKIIDEFRLGAGSDMAIQKCRKIVKEFLGDKIDSAEVYAKTPCDTDNTAALVYAIGHCHIDTCWLWPWDETKRKVARSWSNQCELMDRYPEFRFCCSSAQQYRWLEQYYPSLWDRVCVKVKQGKFQPIGGSWVEHDTNMPSGESLVRQFLYGQRFFESRFAMRCRTFWLPDTFGYSAQLPQLCQLAGMSRFFTQKLSWNNINKFPHTTFRWVALDGSYVLCHMPPSETYNAEARVEDMIKSISQHRSLDQDATSLLVFGKGDGGGGPTFAHIENLRRIRGLNNVTSRLPKVHVGDSVDDFFDRLEKRDTQYVTWYGELYFELHRGTYTTQAHNKQSNRRSEALLHDVEYLATLASIKDVLSGEWKAKGKTNYEWNQNTYKYPKAEIDFMWESVLTCQFHDCLPGSCIEMCYRDSDKLYEQVFKTGQKIMDEAAKHLGYSDKEIPGSHEVLMNLLPWTRQEIDKIEDVYGKEDVAQVELTAPNAFILSNKYLRVSFQDGVIKSLVDKRENRELIAQKGGSGGHRFVMFDDQPLYWQAWDVEVYHLDTRRELETYDCKIMESGPKSVSVSMKTKISEVSWIKTRVTLDAIELNNEVDEVEFPSILRFESEIEWHERMKFLKVEFPVDIRASEASYETQYGIIRRPTHYNTSWDMAKFEVCCHRWADLSEHGYGVAILNDSKYGFAVTGNTMRLSLLRASKAPDEHADMGRHIIRYAILPHQGNLDHRVIRCARNFNQPIYRYWSTDDSGYDKYVKQSVIQLKGSKSIIVDTIKRGEDDADISRGEFIPQPGRSIIVRLYESLGGHAKGYLTWGDIPVGTAYKVNLLEDIQEEVQVTTAADSGHKLNVNLTAFEVVTYKLVLA